MSDLRVSLFTSAKDGVAKPAATTWEDFVSRLGPHSVAPSGVKEALPAFSPAEFRPGMPRLARNVIRVWFGVLDLDKLPGDRLASVVSKLEGLDAVLYTTWSHPQTIQRGLWSARVVVRLSQPVEVTDWLQFWPAMCAYFGAPADDHCKDPCRIYFGPFVAPGTDLSACHYVVFRGAPLDVGKVLAQGPLLGTVKATEKIGRERLAHLAKNWKRARDEYRAHMGTVLDRLVKGEAFAEAGAVDNTIFQLCQDLARVFPHAEPGSLSAHFAQSLQLMAYGQAPHTQEDVKRKLERALEEQAAESAAQELAVISETKLRIREAFAHMDADRDWPYTEAELDHVQGKCRCSREELRKRWVIQRGTLFYLLGPGGIYSAPYTEKDVLSAALRDLAPARSAGVELWDLTAQGNPVRKPLPQIMGEYGSVATDHVLDLRAQEARYDAASRTFIEAPCPVRSLSPAYDGEVAGWLECMFGDALPDALNWIALITDLDNTCAALMLTGPGDTGKGLLAHGLARIWTETQPTDIEQVLGNFNEAIARCPLVFADEQLPKDFRGHGRTAEIRQLIGSKSRPYRKKYAPDTAILGAIRLLIAANNQDVLSFRENLSKDDIQAVADRIFHVKVQAQAIQYLANVNPASFVQQDRIARHALWLRDHYPIRREGRFMIRAKNLETIMALSTKGGIRSAACQWLVNYLKNPTRLDAMGDYRVRVYRGKLLVNTPAILENWALYVQNEAVPGAGLLAQAISALSEPERVHITRPRGGGALHYRAIITQHLHAWAEQTEFATREEIDRALTVDTEVRAQVSGMLPPGPN